MAEREAGVLVWSSRIEKVCQKALSVYHIYCVLTLSCKCHSTTVEWKVSLS